MGIDNPNKFPKKIVPSPVRGRARVGEKDPSTFFFNKKEVPSLTPPLAPPLAGRGTITLVGVGKL
jgi:hypothetical protein